MILCKLKSKNGAIAWETDKLHFQQGTFVNLEITDNYLIISTETSELDILLDNITDSNCHHEMLNDDIVVGNESW